MAQDRGTADIHKLLFTNLVMMLGSSAMQQLGKVVDPLTNKCEVNLEGAQLTIDMLSMLKEKTAGNLDEDEDRMLTDSLSSLQMNYVQTADAEKTGKAEESGEPAGAAPDAPAAQQAPEDGSAPPAASDDTPPDDPKEPKYHKSYGG